MKNYYASSCAHAKQSLPRSLAEPLFVVGCVGVFCAILWLADTAPQAGEAHALALVQKHDLKAESVVIETVGDRVADIIVREAKKWKADLIVMGTHGRRGFNRMVLGSDAEGVLRMAPVPVLMVRSPELKSRGKK